MVATMTAKKNSRGPSEGEVRMTFDMPEGLRKRLKIVAAENDTLMKDLILKWVKAGVEELERKRK